MLEGIDKENWYCMVEMFSDLLQWQSDHDFHHMRGKRLLVNIMTINYSDLFF